MAQRLLQIAGSALGTMRQALDVVAQNVANAQTPGYIRQRAILVPLPAADPQAQVGVGNGVTIAAIERLRNQCLEAQLNHQEGQLGEAQARLASLTRVEAVFNDLATDGLSQALGDFFDALARLQTAPESIAVRDEVVFAAETFARRSREATAALTEERRTLEAGLQQYVAEANRRLQEIADLNARIQPLGDNPQANDLKVAREQAIRQLAQLCGAMAIDQPDGSQDVLLGGVRLVQGGHAVEFTLLPDPTDGTQQLVYVGSLAVGEIIGGKIAGNLRIRAQYKEWQTELNGLIQTFANACNEIHRAGYDLLNRPGEDLFVYDPAAPAGTLRVAAALVGEPERLAAASSPGAPGDATNAQRLLALRQALLYANGTQTIEEAYRQFLSSIGREKQRAATACEAREQLVASLQAQYASEAGVSLDEEALAAMQLQQIYNAAARLIQMADEMMATVLELARP